MQRFYIQNAKLGGDFSLDKHYEIYHQLTKVLRSKTGDEVIFFDGENLRDFHYKISDVSAPKVDFKYIGETEKNSENSFELALHQAFTNKFSKLEYIVQKGAEVGYSSFVFFRSERSQKLVLSDKKIERLNKIITQAVEQSNRNIIPKLVIQEKLDTSENNTQALSIVFHTDCSTSLPLGEIVGGLTREKANSMNIFVGPEGGFSPGEVEHFEKLGYKKSYLGDRILRCETVSSVVGFFISQQLLD